MIAGDRVRHRPLPRTRPSGRQCWPGRSRAFADDRRAAERPSPISSYRPSTSTCSTFRIVRGRRFTSAERDGGHPVVIVSESVARELWPDGGGVGETFRLEPGSWFRRAADG